MKRVISLFAFALVLGTAGAARADVPPPNSTECQAKKAGDACLDDSMKDGVCAQSTCSKLDYSHGTPPSSVTYACLICTATDGGTGTDAGSSGGTSSGGCAMANGAAGGPFFFVVAALAAGLLRRRRGR